MSKKKKLSTKALSNLTPAKLHELSIKTREQLESLKFDLSIDKLSDYSRIKAKKTELARILTILNQKIISQAKEK